jgi:8-oxo-dGTP pyrophosphatase MutT (NUDIX family)
MSLIKSQTVYRGSVITLNLETVDLPNGHRAELEIIHHPGGAAIVALNEALQVCLLRQFRHAAGGWIWELPAGKLEPAEPPLATARRELIEEAGCSASDWLSLGSYVSSPGVFTEVVHLFLATRLQSAEICHEAAESIEVHWVNFDDACTLAARGMINDGKTALGLLRSQALLATEQESDTRMGGSTGKFRVLSDEPDADLGAELGAGDTVPNLSLEDTTRQLMRGFPGHGSRKELGVNPYDTFPNTSSSTGMHGTQELRKLSEWIKQKRQAEQLKAETEQNKAKQRDWE